MRAFRPRSLLLTFLAILRRLLGIFWVRTAVISWERMISIMRMRAITIRIRIRIRSAIRSTITSTIRIMIGILGLGL